MGARIGQGVGLTRQLYLCFCNQDHDDASEAFAGQVPCAGSLCRAADLHLHLLLFWLAGTPTPSSGGTTPVSYLQPLLAFLQEQPFGSQVSVWQEAVQVRLLCPLDLMVQDIEFSCACNEWCCGGGLSAHKVLSGALRYIVAHLCRAIAQVCRGWAWAWEWQGLHISYFRSQTSLSHTSLTRLVSREPLPAGAIPSPAGGGAAAPALSAPALHDPRLQAGALEPAAPASQGQLCSAAPDGVLGFFGPDATLAVMCRFKHVCRSKAAAGCTLGMPCFPGRGVFLGSAPD